MDASGQWLDLGLLGALTLQDDPSDIYTPEAARHQLTEAASLGGDSRRRAARSRSRILEKAMAHDTGLPAPQPGTWCLLIALSESSGTFVGPPG